MPTPIDDGKRAVLAIRPEAFKIIEQDMDKNTIKVEVSSARRIGRMLYLGITLPDGIYMKAKIWSSTDIEPGSRIYVRISESRCFLYPYPKAGLTEELSPV